MIDENQVTRVLKYIHASIPTDSDFFNKFLKVEEKHIITFMNNQFFRGQDNLISFLGASIEEDPKSKEDTRKMIYKFIADYIETYKEHIIDYLKWIFDKCYSYYRIQSSFKTKVGALGPIKQILLEYSETQLKSVLDPVVFNNAFINLLKTQTAVNMPNTLRGEVWTVLGILHDKFRAYISSKSKEEVQNICLSELKKHFDSNSNFTAIAAILRSFIYSLNQCHLQPKKVEDLFNMARTIMIPLADRFTASIAALQLLQAQSSLFEPLLMKKAFTIFDNFVGLMGHQNKDFKSAAHETFVKIIQVFVNGIKYKQQDPQMIRLFNKIGVQIWEMLQNQLRYDLRDSDESKRFQGSITTIVKILGCLSSLILSINGQEDLHRFFNRLLAICNKKMLKAFGGDSEGELTGYDKIKKMKVILYNQKELVSFLVSFSQILENLDRIQQSQCQRLQEMFVTGVKQYHVFLENYVENLNQAFVLFLVGLSTKTNIFNSWYKKTVLCSFMESLDAKRFDIVSDIQFYRMIEKSSQMWVSILTHQKWPNIVLKQFSKIVFESLQHLFLNLDISYKSNIELEIEDEDKMREQNQQEQDVLNVFFKADQNIEMSNVAEYQYVSSLALVFNELMAKVDRYLYSDRVYEFYEKIIHRIKIFPKSIPLMKVIRSLNLFIVKNDWFNDAQDEGDQKKINQLISVLKNFFQFVCDNIVKYQENYYYEALKMLLSMPLKVFLVDDCEIIKNNLPGIITKSLELGHEIVSLAHESIQTLSNLFTFAKNESDLYLSSCIPYLEKYINFSKNTDKNNGCEQKEQVQSYLFLSERKITRTQISTKVMKFLGSIGGLAHQMVKNSTQDYISWDYYCKLDISIVLGKDTIDINMTKLLARTCWLMQHGNENQKIVSSEFMHGIIIYMIGRSASKTQTTLQTKQNLSNFLDRILPTLLSLSSNQSHPSQQLLHTLLIQTIHFLANTQDPTSPDIQTLLSHTLSLYTGAQDMSVLGSKCLSQLIKWHIKQAPSLPEYPYPLIKTIVRNVWALVGNKKARNGLIHFLIKFLKEIHRNTKLMEIYAIELCSLIVTLGRTDKSVEPLLEYLIKKYLLSIKPYIKNLIIEQKNRKMRKLSTLQNLLSWIYSTAFFSIYRQQRQIGFLLWEEILGRYGSSFDSNMIQGDMENNTKVFLSGLRNSELGYLFGNCQPVVIHQEEPKLAKKLPKITAFGEVWVKIIKRKLFDVQKMIKNFKDIQEIYLRSFCSFIQYLTDTYMNLPSSQRILNYETQKCIIDCILTFTEFYNSFEEKSGFIIAYMRNQVELFREKINKKSVNFIKILFKLLLKPNSIVPNFNYDLIYECFQNSSNNKNLSEAHRRQLIETYYFKQICSVLSSILGERLYQFLEDFIKSEFQSTPLKNIVSFVITQHSFYDRQIRCVLNTLSTFANMESNDCQVFTSPLKQTLRITVQEFEESTEHQGPRISIQKRSLLINYLLQHAQKYQIIRTFLVACIKNDTNIYKKNQKSVLKAIQANWSGVNHNIIDMVVKDLSFLKFIITLAKVLTQDKKENLYQLVIDNFRGVGLNSDVPRIPDQKKEKERLQSLSQMLKICYCICEESEYLFLESQAFQQYVYKLIYTSLDTKNSYQIHTEGMILTGIVFSIYRERAKQQSYLDFSVKVKSYLNSITNFYIPFQCFKAQTSQVRNKCSNYLKSFKEMILLSKDIKLIDLLLSLFKDQDIEGFYLQTIENLLNESIHECYHKSSAEIQKEDLKWMFQIYTGENDDIIDRDCWRNARVVVVEQVVKRMIPVSKQEVLIDFFQNQAEKIINQFLKKSIYSEMGSAKDLVRFLEMKRAGYLIIEELYSNLPRKMPSTEQIHKKQLHKPLIKTYCLQVIKNKFNEQAQIILKEYDAKMAEQKKKQGNTVNKDQLKRPTCMEYLRNYLCQVYNCLIVIFISTQKDEKVFRSYVFQPKGFLFWSNFVDCEKTDFNFQVETNFTERKTITNINKKLQKKIKQKYWSNSLYAIEQEFVPASLNQNIEEYVNPVSAIESSQDQPPVSSELQMDPINKHPCMINLVRIVDFMAWKFQHPDSTPGWMEPIYNELKNDECPLAVRILLTKLILNRPKIFTQNIWAQILVKYLVLKETGGKSLHYFYRDVAMQFLNFRNKGYKHERIDDINYIINFVIKCSLHDNKSVFTNNVELLKEFLKIQGVKVDKKTILNMLKYTQKKEQIKQKYNWRMCAIIALTCCMEAKVPVLDSEQSYNNRTDKLVKFGFFYNFRIQKFILLVYMMADQLVKKYRIAVGTFLGQLLKFFEDTDGPVLQKQQLTKQVGAFLARMNQHSNRNSKQKFSIIVLNTVLRYPAIMDIPLLYQQVQTSMSTYNKQQRHQILQCLLRYTQYLSSSKLINFLPDIFISIRASVTKILNDISDVETSFIYLLNQCCNSFALQVKQVRQTFYYIYDDLERVYGNNQDRNLTMLFYGIVIKLKDFTSDDDIQLTGVSLQLKKKVGKSLLKGLGSSFQQVRELLFHELERELKEYQDTADRMLDILNKLYDPQFEDLWLVNVVPLILSIVKKSSDYTRLRFEQSLGDLAGYYDWDFRRNFKIHNSSQPYTPAFTLSTGAINPSRRPDGTLIPSMLPSLSNKGMIQASLQYGSQDQQVFTVLSSQADNASSYWGSQASGWGASQDNGSYSQNPIGQGQNQQNNRNNNKLNQIFMRTYRRRNKNMEEFKNNNLSKLPSAVKIVGNKVRFNKNFDKDVQGEVNGMQQVRQFKNNSGTLIRKYRIGELPDIQITTKDIVDPMLYLAGHDNQFASELFIVTFVKIVFFSHKEKKQKFKDAMCSLLRSSQKFQYNFVSTLQKTLISLCYNLQESIDFSIKDIAMKSNTIDFGIIYTEENQIQTLNNPKDIHEQAFKKMVDDNWGDLIDLYQQQNQEDLIYGVIIRSAEGDEKKLLLKALDFKKMGNIKKSQDCLNEALTQSSNRRIQQFIKKQKIDCDTILGSWEPVGVQMLNKLNNNESLTTNEQKIFTIVLQNNKLEQSQAMILKEFDKTKCEYEKAILHLLYHKDSDLALHCLSKSIRNFEKQWKKVSSFAFNSKHNLIEEVQKKFELEEFLELFRKQDLTTQECEQLFNKWAERQPSSVYDSSLTYLQILESRMTFSNLLAQKFQIQEKLLIRSKINWLIQMSNGMIQKGIFGGAQTLIKKALFCKRQQKEQFIWDFYDSVANLKLKQLLITQSKQFKDYEIITNLVRRQMEQSKTPITDLQKLKFIGLRNRMFQGYLSSCIKSLSDQNGQTQMTTADFVNKVQLIFGNYNELKRGLKQNMGGSMISKQFQEFKRQTYFQFTLFVENILSFLGEKTTLPRIKSALVQKHYNAERLSKLFFETFLTSLQVSDFTTKAETTKQNIVFSLIMKLLKIIQLYPEHVSDYFSDMVSNKRIPVWIFLYFIPQMMKFINNPALVSDFQDLFRNIASIYPESLIYHFNCSFESPKTHQTPFCTQLSTYLKTRMQTHYKFIDALVLLQFPEIRLRDSLNKFISVPYEKDNVIEELKELITQDELTGKYNKKFISDYKQKIIKVITKLQNNDNTVTRDIKVFLQHIDPNRKQNTKTIALRMSQFLKISDASLFYEQYNSNDWNRIQIPGTLYRKFQEPKPWQKIYIQSFDYTLETLNSKQKPRKIVIYGSDEKKYMLLVKAGEDVRLDQRIEELFEIMNRILKGNSQCSKKQLQIKRFEVTPIRKMMGVFEWVDQSQTLKQFLQTEFKIIKGSDKVNFRNGNRAFQKRIQFLNKISPPGSHHNDANHQHKALLSADKKDVISCFFNCQKQIPYGLLRRALERLSKNYDSFLHIKNGFIANYALVCCATYVLGIGDRHLENFLIHMSSASIVLIDFGYSFGAGFDLGVPELMPFRLTKTFEELMDPVGFDGVFKKSMISSFQAFSENMTLICDYCEVFVDDPLLEWVWSNKKTTSNQAQNRQAQEFESSQQPPERALFTQKIGMVRRKLQGQNPRLLFEEMLYASSKHKMATYAKCLKDAIWGKTKQRQKKISISDTVDELISMATDKNILGRTYIGWNPYV